MQVHSLTLAQQPSKSALLISTHSWENTFRCARPVRTISINKHASDKSRAVVRGLLLIQIHFPHTMHQIPRVISGVIVPMIPEAQEVVGEAPSWWKGKGMAGFLRKKHRLLRSKTTQEVTIASLGLQTCIQLDDSTCISIRTLQMPTLQRNGIRMLPAKTGPIKDNPLFLYWHSPHWRVSVRLLLITRCCFSGMTYRALFSAQIQRAFPAVPKEHHCRMQAGYDWTILR
ncbi:unnamed protein product [Leuciscus chuanchicus]